MKEFGVAFVRGLAYALAFGVAFAFAGILWLFFRSAPPRSAADQTAYSSAAQAQQHRTEQLLDRVEASYDRTDDLILKQEQLAVRMDAVVARWEKQTGITAK